MGEYWGATPPGGWVGPTQRLGLFHTSKNGGGSRGPPEGPKTQTMTYFYTTLDPLLVPYDNILVYPNSRVGEVKNTFFSVNFGAI